MGGCDRVVKGLWCLWVGGRVEGWCRYLGRRKTAISHERLGARRWPTARCTGTGQGYAMAAADGPRAASLYRYGDNTEGRAHSHFKRITTALLHYCIAALHALRACTERVATARAHRCGLRTKRQRRVKGEGGAGAAVCRGMKWKFWEIGAAICGGWAGCAALVA